MGTGEKMPKGVMSSDRTGMKHVKDSAPDHKAAKGETGERVPKGAKSSDGGGEKHVRLNGGVAMGKMDGCGRSAGSKDMGEWNSGRHEGTVYSHKRG